MCFSSSLLCGLQWESEVSQTFSKSTGFIWMFWDCSLSTLRPVSYHWVHHWSVPLIFAVCMGSALMVCYVCKYLQIFPTVLWLIEHCYTLRACSFSEFVIYQVFAQHCLGLTLVFSLSQEGEIDCTFSWKIDLCIDLVVHSSFLVWCCFIFCHLYSMHSSLLWCEGGVSLVILAGWFTLCHLSLRPLRQPYL